LDNLIIFPSCGEDDDPTPAEDVARLTGPQREQRVRWLIMQSDQILQDAIDRWLHVSVNRKTGEEKYRRRSLVHMNVLFSGGNDSTTLAHLFTVGPSSFQATAALHANTGIGIEATRQFVRDTCKQWNLPLIERKAPKPEDWYENLVVDRGMPGPAQHWKYFQRLKERALDAARYDLGVANSRTKAALWIAGRRRAESARREDIPLSEYDGSVIWVSPLAHWTKLDLNTYRLMHEGTEAPVPRNEVADLLHMSGECLCGAFAKPGELAHIGQFFPEVVAEIKALEDKVRAAGHPEELCRWGHSYTGTQLAEFKKGRLCSSCKAPGTEPEHDHGTIAV
jgi:3'-phosphoadenosine 5'-phosphosulfate sulfotransferase (PAPS reductase)/FAD synthetase